MLSFLKPSLAPLILRLGLAVVFIFHGCLKLIVYGGAGWSEDVPTFAQHVVTWAELLCGAALLVGLLSRLAALVLAVLQVCAIASVTAHRDFIGLTSAKARLGLAQPFAASKATPPRPAPPIAAGRGSRLP